MHEVSATAARARLTAATDSLVTAAVARMDPNTKAALASGSVEVAGKTYQVALGVVVEHDPCRAAVYVLGLPRPVRLAHAAGDALPGLAAVVEDLGAAALSALESSDCSTSLGLLATGACGLVTTLALDDGRMETMLTQRGAPLSEGVLLLTAVNGPQTMH